MEHPTKASSNDDENVFLFIPPNEQSSKLVKGSELEWFGEPQLLFAEKLSYPSDLRLVSYPTHLTGLFYASAHLAGQPRPAEPLERNYALSKLWSLQISGPVAFMLSHVTLDANSRTISSSPHRCIVRDMSIEELSRLQSLFNFRSQAEDFIRTVKGIPGYKCTLSDYLRPFPQPSPECVWPHPNWSLKKAVNELCTRLQVKAQHVSATAIDIGSVALEETQARLQFWTKIELTSGDHEGGTSTQLDSFLAPNGPYQKKADSENAACVTFLSDYHDSFMARCDPDLFQRTRSIFSEAGSTARDEENAPKTPSTTSSNAVLQEIIEPSWHIWDESSKKSHIDLFGNGVLQKSIIKPGSGISLGVSCSIKAWISVLTRLEDGDAVVTSKFEQVTVGAADHQFVPVAALCSMRIGESAYFRFSPNVGSHVTEVSALDSDQIAPFLIAIYIPLSTSVSFSRSYPVLSTTSSKLTERLDLCDQLTRDASALYRMKQFKIALDHYQIALKELSHKNLDLFKPGLSVLREDLAWTRPELDRFKVTFIKNRLAVAACCLYIDHWPHHNEAWKLGNDATEEGVLACDAVLRVESKNFTALRRKSLLLTKAHRFEEAKECLRLAEECPEALAEGRASLELSRLEIRKSEANDAKSELELAKALAGGILRQ